MLNRECIPILRIKAAENAKGLPSKTIAPTNQQRSEPRDSIAPSKNAKNTWSTIADPSSSRAGQNWSTENSLCIHLVMLLWFGCLGSYEGPDAFTLSETLSFAPIGLEIIDKKLAHDLIVGRVIEIKDPAPPSISPPLGLIPKHNGGFQKVYHLSYPNGDPVNDNIADNIAVEACSLSYSPLQDISRRWLHFAMSQPRRTYSSPDAFSSHLETLPKYKRWDTTGEFVDGLEKGYDALENSAVQFLGE